MKKKRTKDHPEGLRMIRKGLLIMKLSLFLIVFGVLQSAAAVYSQTWRLSMNEKEISIREALKRIESKSEFRFFYEEKKLDVESKIGININAGTIEEVLAQVFNSQNIEYKVLENNFIVLKPKTEMNGYSSDLMQQQKSISGKVTDSTGASLPGASVSVKGTTN